jgi:hypothetical protein
VKEEAEPEAEAGARYPDFKSLMSSVERHQASKTNGDGVVYQEECTEVKVTVEA